MNSDRALGIEEPHKQWRKKFLMVSSEKCIHARDIHRMPVNISMIPLFLAETSMLPRTSSINFDFYTTLTDAIITPSNGWI